MSVPGRFGALELGAVDELATACDTRFSVDFDYATIISSSVSCCTQFDMLASKAEDADIEQIEKMNGVNIIDLDLWVQIDSVKKPIKRNFVGSGYVSHCWTSALDDHLDHRFIIFKM